MGGANIIDKIVCENRLAFDNHKYLIELLKHIQNTTEDLPDTVLEDEYYRVKDNAYQYPDWYVGLVGFCSSFGNKWFSGYARNGTYDTFGERVSQSIRNIKKQAPYLHNIKFECSDFRNVNNIENCVVYCDIPYKGSTKYKTGDFPYDEFYNWCRKLSEHNIVLVSEYNMPDDFNCIWEKETKTLLDSNKKAGDENNTRVERLFVLRK